MKFHDDVDAMTSAGGNEERAGDASSYCEVGEGLDRDELLKKVVRRVHV
jgi:hypothetical protein